MDDISEKLAGILNDPDSMEKVRKMADSLFSEEKGNSKPESEEAFDIPSLDEMNAIISIVSKLKADSDDGRARLINALKPYLSEHRRGKADTAIKLLKIIELLPLIKDSGILNI